MRTAAAVEFEVKWLVSSLERERPVARREYQRSIVISMTSIVISMTSIVVVTTVSTGRYWSIVVVTTVSTVDSDIDDVDTGREWSMCRLI